MNPITGARFPSVVGVLTRTGVKVENGLPATSKDEGSTHLRRAVSNKTHYSHFARCFRVVVIKCR